jgi:hypothetical protein
MKTKSFSLAAALFAVGLCMGCRRDDPRVNSNPPPQGAGATHTNSTAKPDAQPAKADPKTVGTDSAGRPADASGGTTGADRDANRAAAKDEKPKAQ